MDEQRNENPVPGELVPAVEETAAVPETAGLTEDIPAAAPESAESAGEPADMPAEPADGPEAPDADEGTESGPEGTASALPGEEEPPYVPVNPDITQEEIEAKVSSAMEQIVSETIGDAEIPKKKRGVSILLNLLTGAVLLGTAAAGYLGYAKCYEERYIPGTEINGVDATNLTLAGMDSRMRTKVENRTLTLKFREEKEEVISGSAMKVQYISGSDLEKVLAGQDHMAFVKGIFGERESYTVGEDYTFDEEELKRVILSLPEFQPENYVEPVNAMMEQLEDGSVAAIPEIEGTRLNPISAGAFAAKAVREKKDVLDYSAVKGSYFEPTLRADSSEMAEMLDDINGFLDTTVTYELHDDKTATVDKSVTREWLSKGADGLFYLDEDEITSYCEDWLEELADEDDVTHSTMDFKSTRRGTIAMDCPEYGHEIDVEGEAELLCESLMEHESDTRAPEYDLNKTESEAIGDTYVEVDLENQHVYFYVDGDLYMETDCISGYPYDRETETVKGIFDVYTKQRERTLKGRPDSNGNPSYTALVHFWMPFYKAYGLHDASWRGRFGGNIYKSDGSHGCVNMPYSAAQKMYEKIEVGTPVVVF